MEFLFYNCSLLKSINISSFKTDTLLTMDSMFSGCSSLTSVDLSGFNTDKVTNMMSTFASCNNLVYLDISHFSAQADFFDFFTSLPNSGTIKLNNKVNEKIQSSIPSGWKKEFV